jgi:hypothetical protein
VFHFSLLHYRASTSSSKCALEPLATEKEIPEEAFAIFFLQPGSNTSNFKLRKCDRQFYLAEDVLYK